jgi:DNA-binding response OmpR family regulator
MRIAILEDERSQAFLLQHCLLRAGHLPKRYETGCNFLEAVRLDPFDLLLLDWETPGMTGLEVIKIIRRDLRSSVPAIMVTSRTTEQDIVEGLRAGADDFVEKPFRVPELLARVESVARHQRCMPSQPPLQQANVRVEFDARRIAVNGVPVTLSVKDYALAVFMLERVGRLVSRREIVHAVWGSKIDQNSRSVDTHMSRIRLKLGLNERNGWQLLAAYGEGYRLDRINRQAI